MTKKSNIKASTSDDPLFFFGHSINGNIARSIDWSNSPLGKAENWSNDLKTMLAMMFSNRHPVCLFWGDEKFYFYNDAYIAIVGQSKHPSAMGKKGQDVWSEVWDLLAPQIEGAFNGQASWNEDQYIPVLGDDGKPRDAYFTYSYSPVYLANGSVNGTLVTCTETTAKIMAEKKLQIAHAESELDRKRLFNFFMQAPIPMVILEGPDHLFTLVNPPYENLFQKKAQGKTVLEAFALEEVADFIPLLDGVYKTGIPYVGHELPLGDLWIDIGYYPFLDSSGKIIGIMAIVIDVTKQVLDRRQIENSLRELENERELREKFVAALSHDLRTPLTAAKMSSELIARKLSDDPAMFKAAHRITDNMNRADGMIRDILDASLIKAGEKVHLRIQLCDFNKIINDVIEDLEGIHGDKFILKVEEGIEGYWDLNGIKRIIENLLSNAIKYGEIGSKVTVTADKLSKNVCLSVHNKGFPIPENELLSLFDQYKRSQTAFQSGQKGWGLGLTLVKGITESHGGKVWVESNSDQGTTFWVELPTDSRF